jgi:hypothetical protein
LLLENLETQCQQLPDIQIPEILVLPVYLDILYLLDFLEILANLFVPANLDFRPCLAYLGCLVFLEVPVTLECLVIPVAPTIQYILGSPKYLGYLESPANLGILGDLASLEPLIRPASLVGPVHLAILGCPDFQLLLEILDDPDPDLDSLGSLNPVLPVLLLYPVLPDTLGIL